MGATACSIHPRSGACGAFQGRDNGGVGHWHTIAPTFGQFRRKYIPQRNAASKSLAAPQSESLESFANRSSRRVLRRSGRILRPNLAEIQFPGACPQFRTNRIRETSGAVDAKRPACRQPERSTTLPNPSCCQTARSFYVDTGTLPGQGHLPLLCREEFVDQYYGRFRHAVGRVATEHHDHLFERVLSSLRPHLHPAAQNWPTQPLHCSALAD
jgi:hypothetical protein